MRKKQIVLGICLWTIACLCAEKREILFPQHPRLAYTAEELALWRDDVSRTDERLQIVKKADEIIARKLVIPQKEGEWIFYYACPKDGCTLSPRSDTEHICPRCGSLYTDERTQAAYRTMLNYRLDNDIYALALAFALTGDAKYALPARDALLELSHLYPTFERHDRWGRRGIFAVVGGRRYAQHLDEAYSVIKLAKAYDLIAGASFVSQVQRDTIESFLKTVVQEIRKYQFFVDPQGKNNHISWFNAAYACVGVATGDQSLVEEAVYGKFGLLYQLEKSVTSDGIWYEGALAYHFYALSAIQELLKAVSRVGLDFSKNEKLKSMYLGPIRMAYPDGSVPAFHDSDRFHLRNWVSFYKFALDYFHDKSFAQYVNPDEIVSEQESMVLPGIGVVALRSGIGKDAICVMMDYGIHGGSHGHPDKLNIVLYAMGKELIPDIGRINYSVPEYETWARTTVAHNTVVLGRKNQSSCEGNLVYFNKNKDLKSALCTVSNAYQNVLLKRLLILSDKLLIDVYTVDAPSKTTIDWIVHIRGEITGLETLSDKNTGHLSLGKGDGYQHLADIACWGTMPQVKLNAVQNDGKIVGIYMIHPEETQLFIGTGIGHTLDERIPFIMRRTVNQQGYFITVYDLSGTGNAVTSIRTISFTGRGKLSTLNKEFVLRILCGKKEMAYKIDLRNNAKSIVIRIH